MRPDINFNISASPYHIIRGRSGYDLNETAKYCAQYPKCLEIIEFCNMWVAVRSPRGSGTSIFRKQIYIQAIHLYHDMHYI